MRTITISFFAALLDLKSKYRGSVLGPFWSTLNAILLISTLTFIYSNFFNLDFTNYFLYLFCGFVIWWFIVDVINESSNLMIQNANLIKNTLISYEFIFQRLLFKNALVLLHSFLFILCFILFKYQNVHSILQAIFGLILLSICLYFTVKTISIFSIRFRDLPFIISSLLSVFTFVTPIIYDPIILEGRFFIAQFNPFFHLIEVVRSPLLQRDVSLISYIFVTGLIFLSFLLSRYSIRKFKSFILIL